MKKIITVIVVIASAYYWFYYRPHLKTQVALSNSKMTLAQMLEGSTEKLAASCSQPDIQSRMDMSQSECEQLIRERNPICYERTTKKWPQVIDNQKDLDAAMDDYAACLWAPLLQ